ncbi:uncharacterized protein [Symphalangus syndactylus]|uniref:uncharacterized protein n=1 Tax=Symphalangus syndactylus TaxID=9590 RepID=UPI0030076EBA
MTGEMGKHSLCPALYALRSQPDLCNSCSPVQILLYSCHPDTFLLPTPHIFLVRSSRLLSTPPSPCLYLSTVFFNTPQASSFSRCNLLGRHLPSRHLPSGHLPNQQYPLLFLHCPLLRTTLALPVLITHSPSSLPSPEACKPIPPPYAPIYPPLPINLTLLPPSNPQQEPLPGSSFSPTHTCSGAIFGPCPTLTSAPVLECPLQKVAGTGGALQAHGATAPHRSLLAIHLHLAPASSVAMKATGPHNAQTQISSALPLKTDGALEQIPQQLPSLHWSQG